MSDSGGAGTSATAGEILLVAVFSALVTGAVEVSTKSFRILVLHRIIGVSADFPWMTPLAYVIFFVPGALILLATARVLRRPLSLHLGAAVFAFFGVLALLLPYSELATLAEALLAAGVASQVFRWVRANPHRARLHLRGATLTLAALVGLAGGGVRAWRAYVVRRSVAALPPSATGKPNVLLIIFDTVRRGNVSLYGYPRPTTPELTQWARTGVVFENAIAPAPWTLPTHASMFTGLRPSLLHIGWKTPLPVNGARTLAEALRSQGYNTGGFVSNHFYASFESGLERGFTHYDDYRITPRLILANAAYGRSALFNDIIDHRTPRGFAGALRRFNVRRSMRPSFIHRMSPEITDSFLAWQKEGDERPFFAFINYMAAHKPYRAYEPWLSKFASSPPQRVDAYDAAIARLDHEVGRMLDSLQRRGILDNTIVVVASDHGEQFGEHGLHEHGNSLYLPLLEVPLVMRFPKGMPAGRRVSALVSLQDVGATILDLSGSASQAHFPGSSLARYWTASPPGAELPVLSELTRGLNVESISRNYSVGLQSIMDDRFHYIHNDAGEEELYEYHSDSHETHNLASKPSMQGEVERMRRHLAAARGGAGERPVPPP